MANISIFGEKQRPSGVHSQLRDDARSFEANRDHSRGADTEVRHPPSLHMPNDLEYEEDRPAGIASHEVFVSSARASSFYRST